MDVQYELEAGDVRANFERVLARRRFQTGLVVLAALGFLLSLTVLRDWCTSWTPRFFWAAIFACVLPLLFVVFLRVVVLRRAMKSVPRGGDGVVAVHVDDEGITRTSPLGSLFRRWRAVSAVERSSKFLFVNPTPVDAIIVPRRAFSSDDDWNAFVEFVEDRFAHRRQTSSPSD